MKKILFSFLSVHSQDSSLKFLPTHLYTFNQECKKVDNKPTVVVIYFTTYHTLKRSDVRKAIILPCVHIYFHSSASRSMRFYNRTCPNKYVLTQCTAAAAQKK